MAISDRIQSIEEHIKESYQELEGLGIDTTEVDKNLENIPKLIDGYWETLPKVTGEGTSITLDNTKEGKMKINLKGNTSQTQTTQSKNLLPNTATTQTINGLTFTVNNDKSISISGTPTATTTFEINSPSIKLPAGTYTMSTHKEGTTSGNAYINVRLADESANVTTINLHIASSSTFTLEQETELYVRVYSSSNITFTDFKIYPMIESGETVTDYVEFVPNSPSPDYPQDIHVVSGNNTINVCGKNILYYTNQTTSWGGAKINTNGNTITYTPNDSGQGGMGHTTYTQDIFIPAGSTLTYSQRYVSGSAWTSGSLTNSIILYRKDGTYLSKGFGDITTSNYQNTKKVIFTTEEDYIGIKCYSMMYAIAGMTTPLVYNVQLEYNSDITDFEPYQSQSYPITLGSSTNTFDVSKVLQGVYSDISQYNSKRLTLFGELKSNGYVVDVVCNNPNLQFGILRTSMNTISSSNQNLQSSGWYPNYSSLEFDGEGYVCILIKKADDSDITINDISSNDFVITQSYELCKLGDYQDYIYKTNGNWYFHKNILKVCINGENWVKQADYVFYKRFLYITDKTTKQQTYCNQFIWDNRNSGMINLADNHFAQQSTTALYLRDSRNQNLPTFASWINANPLIIYFRLTNPTDTQITDTTLISQLEAINYARSYTSQTNISQESNDLASILNATALSE